MNYVHLAAHLRKAAHDSSLSFVSLVLFEHLILYVRMWQIKRGLSYEIQQQTFH